MRSSTPRGSGSRPTHVAGPADSGEPQSTAGPPGSHQDAQVGTIHDAIGIKVTATGHPITRPCTEQGLEIRITDEPIGIEIGRGPPSSGQSMRSRNDCSPIDTLRNTGCWPVAQLARNPNRKVDRTGNSIAWINDPGVVHAVPSWTVLAPCGGSNVRPAHPVSDRPSDAAPAVRAHASAMAAGASTQVLPQIATGPVSNPPFESVLVRHGVPSSQQSGTPLSLRSARMHWAT